MKLRQYQRDAVEAVLQAWQEVDRTLLVLPTGTGKTVVFSEIGNRVLDGFGSLLILAHRAELLWQARDKFERVTGIRPDLERAEETVVGTWTNCVVGSVQSFSEDRLAKFPRDAFSHIIIDEAHHTLASSYMRVLDRFDGAKVLGVTATADRGDKRNLGEVYQSVAYEMSLRDAVADGWLVDLKALTLPIEMELVNTGTGDYSANDCAHAIEPYLNDIARQMADEARDRKTLCFLPLIDTSRRFRDMCEAYGLEAREVNGESEDRQETLEWFSKAGKGSVLCNSLLLCEGFDEPSIDCVSVLRPTKVRSLMSQMIGRGTRPSPGKTDLLILDFLWNTEKFDLCRPAHLVSRNPELAFRVSEILAEESQGKAVGLLDAADAAESIAKEEREESLRRELEAQRMKKKKLVDPLQYRSSIVDDWEQQENDLCGLQAPTKAQLEAIEKFGINPEEIKSFGEASHILDALIRRKEEKLSTPKQIRCLERYGFREVGTWLFEDAKKMIAILASNTWRLPNWIVPEEYAP